MKIIRLNLFRYGAETFWKHSIFFSKNLNIQAKFGQASTGFSRLKDWVMCLRIKMYEKNKSVHDFFRSPKVTLI